MKSHTIKGLCLLAAILSGVGWGTGRWWANRTDAEMRRNLLGQVVSIARTFDPELVRQLSFTEADANTPAFEYIRRQMTAFGERLPQGGIYSMTMRDGKLVFGPESYGRTDPMASGPGTVYQRPSPDDIAIFTTHRPVTIGPMTDESGTIVSALAPVFDPSTDEMLMAVGIDVPADDWQAAVQGAGRKAAFATLMAGLALLGAVAAIRTRRRWAIEAKLRSTGPAPARFDRDPIAPGVGRYANTGLLLAMGILAIVFLTVVLLQSWCWSRAQISRSAGQQARLLVEFDNALRDYVARHIRPEMEKRVGPGEFMPETMSTSFISRSVFDAVHEVLPDSMLRFASTNPRNPANRATPSEEELIRYFERNPEIDAWSGTMPFFANGEKHLVYAIARRFGPSCLQCHGRAEDAPATLRQRYGAIAGFGRSVGEVSLDLAAIPVSASYAEAGTKIWRHMLAAFGLCTLFLAGIAALIRTDVRQRRRVERSLRASEQRLSSIVQGSPMPTFIIDADHRVIHWNRAMEQLSAITADEVLGTTEHWRAFYATSRPCMADLLVEGTTEAIPHWYPGGFTRSDLVDEAYEATAFFPDKDPDGLWLHLTAAVIRDDRGHLVGVMETLRDVTEQKQAEEQLQKNETFIKAVLDNIPLGVAVNSVEPPMQFEYMNDNFPRLYRTTREALACADGFWDAVYEDPKFREELRQRVLADCASGDPGRMRWDDVPIARGGQPTTFVSTKNAIIPNRQLMISIVWDVTEHKRVENKLKESVSLLEATLEATADGILVVDGFGAIKNFNEQFKDLWRLPTEVLDTMDDNQALASALPQLTDPDAFLAKVKQLWSRRDRADTGLLHFIDGRVVEYCSKPQYLGDQITGRVWSFRDVTDRHEAQQEQKRLMDQVAAINEELTHFAYVVSHDLKAPLRGIKMLTEWLCTDYSGQVDDEGRENLHLLQNRVERMHNLIEGVLQYSRVGRVEEDVVEVDLEALLPGIIDTIAPPEHIAIRVEGRLPTVECEKTRITQVLQNLLTNAVKYMDKPAGDVVVACCEDEDAWTFSVSDNGPGIEERYFEKIFSIFQTLAPRDEFESTGVGLTLVKKIVEHYGGRVWLTSEVGKGSTFFFTLPRESKRTHHERLQASTVD